MNIVQLGAPQKHTIEQWTVIAHYHDQTVKAHVFNTEEEAHNFIEKITESSNWKGTRANRYGEPTQEEMIQAGGI